MPRGGARAGAGRAPDPNSLRQMKLAEKNGLKLLPAVYTGESPEWPLTYTSPRQQELWAAFWTKPQARIWADQHMEYELAIHIQTLVEAETPNAPSSVRTLLLQQMNSLLLSLPSLLKAGYRVSTADDDAPSGRSSGAKTTAAARGSSRARLRAVPKPDADASP